ncbi:MAG: histidine phosphatase family protein [Acidimicrobiia bacterium]|nr:histidine phosphatase family protein [Acidimicrobiia bacterium]
MSSTDTRLVVIRHGESMAQVNGIISGHDTCVGLSDLGRAQAAALRERLVHTGELAAPDRVYTSNLYRAVETADIIGTAFGDTPRVHECEWCEIRAGVAEGLTYAEFRAQHKMTADSDDPYRGRTPEGGESWAQFYERAGARLRRVADDHPGERVVVVAHGGIVAATFVALGELPMRMATDIAYETVNTSLTEWRWTGTEWRLVRFNDAAHLAGL